MNDRPDKVPADENIAPSPSLQSLRIDFYRKFLKRHEGRRHSSWMFNMMARRKYYAPLAQASIVLCRESLKAEGMTEQKFLNLLELLEYKASQWTDFKTGKRLPREACVCYMTANILDEKMAFFLHFEEMSRQVKDLGMGCDSLDNSKAVSSVTRRYKSCLEKSSIRDYVKLDVDTKDPICLSQLSSTLHENGIEVAFTVETRGGAHVLIPCGQDLKHLYELEKRVTTELGKQGTWLTIEAPKLSPRLAVPGMYQSEFLPQLTVAEFNWRKVAHDSEEQ
mmetsp:Transcript_24602/g.45923  ORF Transcript_24602/g.45923 Transcript_24602/m.45923 type:complete len:279 (-) Transcript_24602:1281-2117(-)